MNVRLPDEVVQAWEARNGPVVLCTVNGNHVPNAIYASITSRMKDGRFAVVDNFFHKTQQNILSGSRASFLFITKAGKAYQVVGSVEYCTSGPLYDEMRSWAEPSLPRVGVAIINAEAVFSGKEQLA
jgi:predicted pyridoxine 5'-phosphate oxidase superfamily flavin-nucleotide-binding protein